MTMLEREKENYRLLNDYGMTIEEYEEKLKLQNNGCAICGINPSVIGRKLCVDHQHRTRQIRGLLCNKCNSALGWVENRNHLLEKCKEYLIKWNILT